MKKKPQMPDAANTQQQDDSETNTHKKAYKQLHPETKNLDCESDTRIQVADQNIIKNYSQFFVELS